MPAPSTYRKPCRITHGMPIKPVIFVTPYIPTPWRTGITADNPMATNMPARNGRHFGVRNMGNSEVTAQPAPIVVI